MVQVEQNARCSNSFICTVTDIIKEIDYCKGGATMGSETVLLVVEKLELCEVFEQSFLHKLFQYFAENGE